MADTAVATKSKLNIPDDVREKFPELISMVEASQSMNPEERQYWVDVLPMMTEDQVENLRGILTKEKKQRDNADKSLESGMQEEVNRVTVKFDEVKYQERKKLMKEAEVKHEEEEKLHEEELLKEIENM